MYSQVTKGVVGDRGQKNIHKSLETRWHIVYIVNIPTVMATLNRFWTVDAITIDANIR